MSLPYSSSTPADDPMKKEECHKAAAAVRNMLIKVQLQTGKGYCTVMMGKFVVVLEKVPRCLNEKIWDCIGEAQLKRKM